MARPKTENGHTEIANELLEALYQVPLASTEFRVFLYILRKTYGFKKKQDWISQKQMAKEFEIYKQHVSRAIKRLKRKNMITNNIEKNKKILGIQKDYELWKLPELVTKRLSKLVTNKNKLPESVTIVTKNGYQKLPKLAHTKETLTKETIQKNIYKEVFDYWNSKEIIQHRVLDEDTKRKIISMLKIYTPAEIKKTIHIYSVIIKDEDDEYFFHHRYTLKDFLGRKFEEFKSAEAAHNSFLKYEKKGKQNGKYN